MDEIVQNGVTYRTFLDYTAIGWERRVTWSITYWFDRSPSNHIYTTGVQQTKEYVRRLERSVTYVTGTLPGGATRSSAWQMMKNNLDDAISYSQGRFEPVGGFYQGVNKYLRPNNVSSWATVYEWRRRGRDKRIPLLHFVR